MAGTRTTTNTSTNSVRHIAIRKLIDKHKAEFTNLLMEERVLAGFSPLPNDTMKMKSNKEMAAIYRSAAELIEAQFASNGGTAK